MKTKIYWRNYIKMKTSNKKHNDITYPYPYIIINRAASKQDWVLKWLKQQKKKERNKMNKIKNWRKDTFITKEPRKNTVFVQFDIDYKVVGVYKSYASMIEDNDWKKPIVYWKEFEVK